MRSLSMLDVALGMDSVLICFSCASFIPDRRRQATLAVVVGIFDALASLVAGSEFATTVLLTVLACAGVTTLALLRRGWGWLAALPLLLSLDNLASPLRPMDALAAGLVSAAMAAGGLAASSALMRYIPERLRTAVTVGVGCLSLTALRFI